MSLGFLSTMTEERLAIFAEISAERTRQAAKFPEAGEHDLFVLCAVLGEECGEVQKAAIDLRFALLRGTIPRAVTEAEQDLRAELIQAAAVAVKMVELLDSDRIAVHRDSDIDPPEPEGNPS
jgi:hypothetical protein